MSILIDEPTERGPIPFATLQGCTLTRIDGLSRGSEEIVFHVSNGDRYILRHDLACCEEVYVEDIAGHERDLLLAPIVHAEEVSMRPFDSRNEAAMPLIANNPKHATCTWTFYRLATWHGSVVIRWYGGSNGYYAEKANLWHLRAPLPQELCL